MNKLSDLIAEVLSIKSSRTLVGCAANAIASEFFVAVAAPLQEAQQKKMASADDVRLTLNH